MAEEDRRLTDSIESREEPPVPCGACRDAISSPSRDTVSFLLIDQFTVPVVGCETHLERFRAVCGLTSEEPAQLLSHVPAGGVPCPGCRLSSHGTARALLPVRDGAAVVLACPEHQSAIAGRYGAGREAEQRLFGDLEGLSSD
jgi:hypothetical protein